MTITERMDAALSSLEQHWKGRRSPKAFYLAPDDWAEFMETDPPVIRTPFGNNPQTWVDDPAFRNVPVRASKTLSQTSRLYDHCGYGRYLPGCQPTTRTPSDIDHAAVEAALDQLSRTRALTEQESCLLERAIKRQPISKRECVRLGVKRKMGVYLRDNRS